MTQISGQPGRPRQRSGGGGGWIIPVLLVAMIAVPIIEVWGLIQVGQAIGALPTVLILIAEAALGTWLMRREGGKAWQNLREAMTPDKMASGKMPGGELASGALILVGGTLLMLPGFFTDIIGLFFLLPFTRPLARRLLAVFIARRVRQAGVDVDVIRAHVDRENNIDGDVAPPSAGFTGPNRRAEPPGSDDGSDSAIIKGEVEP